MQSSEDTGTRKILSAVSHGSIFFNTLVVSIGVPIAILLLSQDSVIKESAKEAINFHLNMWFWWTVAGILAWLLIGIPMLVVLGIVNFIMPIVAIFYSVTNPNTAFRYPLILRLF
ncbi:MULTISPECIES: DUF4870 domain-containing protein [Cyanophyceae]|uniref:DUF4870 domain-containing protein n=1 Tax=Cyanophyceae TaxID=3028117 RepID=UPI00168A1C75|nr:MULTISPECIES: DUF4870 domain-containing protein [Cyanophyceae]MBD1916958.1 DUF4870 domain-containing protein [Phormidium sp. FACHB-77]MBD2029809.1 DUF4870 domain-containing protein [Phormidium sp. FACHB-322]MBD2050403.1 DUF4870 domain-containing protein [Leptolyngbya sp. FACHB-60]